MQVVEHQRPQRVEGADHHEHRGTHRHRGEVRTDAQQVERESRRDLRGSTSVSATRVLAISGYIATVSAAISRNGALIPNGPTSTAEMAGPTAKPATSAASIRPEVLAEVIGIGQDHDPARSRVGEPDTDTHHEPRA